MAFPYQLYGGATRPDALNFNPDFSQALISLYNAAPPEVQRELGLTSGFRDTATQARLFNASDKSGHMVAAPGHSKHESGTAADLYGFGTGGGKVSDATKAWIHQNAGAHGLYFPMSYEPWHIQLGKGGAAAPSGGGGDANVASTLAGAVDPRAAVMAQLENNPWKTIADTALKRGGLVGEGSAGGGLNAPSVADPGIPALETASANAMPTGPDPLAAQPGSFTSQLGDLASLFTVKPTIGAAAQAKPTRRA